MVTKRLIVILLSFLAFLTGSGDVLFWQVDDTARVYSSITDDTGTSIMDFIGDRYCAARVKVIDNNSTYFLPVYCPPPPYSEYPGELLDGEWGVEFGDTGSGHWGCGVPTGNQAPLPSEMYMEYAFMVEIGELTWNDIIEDYDWTTTIAQTDEFTAQKISEYIYEQFALNAQDLHAWTPTKFYTTPESSSGLLSLLGALLLMLRRKHHEKA